MQLKIVKYPDPVLAQKCEPVEEITGEIRALIDDMLETMYEGKGVGLAAPQVGKALRLVTIDESGPENRTAPIVLINPEIVDSEGSVESDEGCLSVVGAQFKIKRKERVTVRGLDKDGKEVEIKTDGMLAIILQHELDHLDGVLIIDHISRFKRSLYDNKVKKWLKHNRIS